MERANSQKVKAINAALARLGQMDNKPDIIKELTQGRTSSSRELTEAEADKLLQSLNKLTKGKNPSYKMLNKLFAMAHEINYIPIIQRVTKKGLVEKKDYSRLHSWVEKYGSLKKALNEYTYSELPGLVSQFEFGPYKAYIAEKNQKQ